MRTERLFDVAPVVRKVVSTDLVPVATTACPGCGSSLKRIVMDEPVLFRHGGHGATRRTTIDHCTGNDPDYFLTNGGTETCRWSLVRSVQEVRPS